MIEGEGVGWLKLNRIRKLMEDENYRNLVVSRLNKTLDQKIGPDEHIDDVVRLVIQISNYNSLKEKKCDYAVRDTTSLEGDAQTIASSNSRS